jgi:hypothetical protein
MPNASKLTNEGRFMALFVGPKHSGKTVAACSVQSSDPTKRTKVLDADGRIRGILGASWIDRSRIDYDYFVPNAQTSFYQRVNESLEGLIVQCNTMTNPYETYIGDSLTAITHNFVQDALPLTHAGNKGKKIGVLAMPGPEDYGFESTGTNSFLSCLRSLPIQNIIITAHVVDKYDKPRNNDGSKDTFADSIVVGEKLSLRDKISANATIYFDHIFRFDREIVSGKERFFVEFISDIACTSFTGLKPGYYDITGLNFWEYLQKLLGQNDQVLTPKVGC